MQAPELVAPVRGPRFVTALRAGVQWYRARLPTWLRIAFVVAWAGVIWGLSSQPQGPSTSHPVFSHVWNLGHVVVFGVLAGLALLSSQGCTAWHAVIAVILAGSYGVVDELHQGGVVGRVMDGWDVCSDSIGACLVTSGLHWLLRRDRRAGTICLVCLPLAAMSVHMASR